MSEGKLYCKRGADCFCGDPSVKCASSTLVVQTEEIKRPSYYERFEIEPVTFIMMNNLPFWAGNVVKYICRAPYKHKTEEEDIKKAIRYCEMRLEEIRRRKENCHDVIGNPL